MLMATAVCGPTEVADRGPAERVFDLAVGKISGQQVLAVTGCGVAALMCLVMAIPLLVCAVKPFGRNAPPPALCLAIGGVMLTGALGFAYGVCHYLERAGAAAYHLYADGFAIIGPDGTERWVAWEQLGTEKAPPNPFNPRHVFPVEGEADVVFDYASGDHAELATSLTQKATLGRWAASLGPGGTAALAGAGRPVAAFLVYDASDTGLYRVSPLAGKLLFVRVGDGCAAGTRGFKARPEGVQGGLAGGMVAWSHMKQIERLQETLDTLAGADERRLFELALGLRGSRLLAPAELGGASLGAVGAWEKMTLGPSVVGVLKFRHADWGDKKLYFESLGQLGDAVSLLEHTFGGDFRTAAMHVAADA
jgi:hypothetical protein